MMNIDIGQLQHIAGKADIEQAVAQRQIQQFALPDFLLGGRLAALQ